MSSHSRRIPVLIELTRDERGAALISVVLISMLIGSLAALALNTGEQAQRSSARDRNHEIALGVAEAGIHQAISVIDTHTMNVATDACLSGDDHVYQFGDWCPKDENGNPVGETVQTPEGPYTFWYARTHRGFEIVSDGTSGGASLGRSRRIRVEVLPSPLFEAQYALFSDTSITLKNNNEVLDGDVWARRSVTFPNGTELRNGSVTSQERWVELKNGAKVDGDVRAGGYNVDPSQQSACKDTQDWAICNQGEITGVVSVPGDIDCAPADAATAVHGSGTFNSETITCASPPGPDERMPEFQYDPRNYESVQEFATAGQFMEWLEGNESGLSGTFYIEEPNPSQDCKPNPDREFCRRIDLTGVSLGGDTTIISRHAPVFAQNLNDEVVHQQGGTAMFVLVSFYEQPVSTKCDENGGDCAINLSNNFQASGEECTTVALLYANKGPIAVKNNSNADGPDMCGSVIGVGIHTKNNQEFKYSDEIDRVLGFQTGSFEIARWVECPVSDDPDTC